MNNKLISNQGFKATISMTKNIMVEIKKGFTRTILPDQGLDFLLMMHMKRSFNGKEMYLCLILIWAGGGDSLTPTPCWCSLNNSKMLEAVTLAF